MQRRRIVIVPAIIFLNVIVFLLWHTTGSGYAWSLSQQFMFDHFLISWTALAQGQYWGLIGSVFSHNMLWHILINMFVLQSFGSITEMVLGRMRFFWFYMIAGVVSSLCHAVVSAYLLGAPDLPALGASGAISGLVLLFALMFPREKILLLGLIPIPALWGALGFMCFDLFGLFLQARGGGLPIGHGAHLGGALTGIIYFFLFIKPRMKLKSAAGGNQHA